MNCIKDAIVVDAKVLAANDKYALCYRKGDLFRLDILSMRLEFLTSLPYSPSKRLLTKCQLTERLLRLEPRTAISLDDTTFLFTFNGKIVSIDIMSGETRIEHEFRQGMNNPLNLIQIQGLRGFGNSILYGEYFSNNGFEDVRIWQRIDGVWKTAYTFRAGLIYHIHSLVADYKNSCLYVLTGDSDEESGIWKMCDNFQSIQRILGGSQQYRSCVAFPYNNCLLYATDTPHENNRLYCASQNDGKWVVESKYDMPGPCIYGIAHNGKLFFATSVEADDLLPAYRYRFSYKLGVGVKDRFSHIVSMDESGTVKELCRFKKDIWPMLLFQFGNCLFPNNSNEKYLMICPQSVCTYHGKTLLMEI